MIGNAICISNRVNSNYGERKEMNPIAIIIYITVNITMMSLIDICLIFLSYFQDSEFQYKDTATVAINIGL